MTAFVCDMMISTESKVQASARPARATAPTAHPLAQEFQVKFNNGHIHGSHLQYRFPLPGSVIKPTSVIVRMYCRPTSGATNTPKSEKE
jgi:hypothetical protein